MNLKGHRAAAFLLSLSLALSVLALATWARLLPIELLAMLHAHPTWPFTLIASGSVAAGFLAAITGHERVARAIWMMPLLICGIALIEWIGNIDLDVDRLLFADRLATIAEDHAGRPSVLPCLAYILLSVSGLVIVGGRRKGSLLLATLIVLPAIFLLISIFEAADIAETAPWRVVVSLLYGVSLPLGILLWLITFGWVDVTSTAASSRRVLRTLLPLALMLPLIPTLLSVTMFERIGLPGNIGHLLVVLGNVTIVASLLYWGTSQVVRGEAERARMSEALNNTAVAFVDDEGRITHWSAGCEELYGWSAAEALGRQKYGLLQSHCDIHDPLSRDAKSGTVELIETRKDGRVIWTLERAQEFDDGEGARTVLSMADVTDRVAATRALRLSEERLAAAVSAHEIGVFEWDVALGRITWSPGTAQRLGILPSTISDFETVREMIDTGDLQEVYATLAETVKHRAPRFAFRYRLRGAPSGIHAVEGSARAFYDGQGNLIRVIGVILDISEREERELELRQREEHLRSILQTVPDAMLVVDEQGVVQEFSVAAETLWGYRAADVVGHRFTVLSPPAERENRMQALRDRLADSKTETGLFKAVSETAEGRRFPFEARSAVARTDGKVLVTIFVRDLSDQLAAEERMSDLNAEMAHVSRIHAMSELAADLAHELNQPLSATSNFLAASRMLLERGRDIEPAIDLLRMAAEQTQRAGEIIRRMRAFMASGEVEMARISLPRTIRDAVGLVMVGTGALNIELHYELDPEVHMVFADRIQVQQVLVNLLRNAMEALRDTPMGEPRRIRIGSQRLTDGMIEVEVADNGPGITPDFLETLFSRFTSTKGPTGGMGIGLSIARRIIEAHGGTLQAENMPEGGARFCFTLPVMEQGVEP